MADQNWLAPAEQSKRDFLKYIFGGGIVALMASIFYPILAYLKPPPQAEVEVTSVEAGSLDDLPPESGRIIRFGSKPVIVVRSPEGEVKAFSATCTHLDCTVQYRKDMGIIWCACHNGQYDLNGRNIGGPPPRPLGEYRVILKDNDIFVAKKT